MNFTSERKYMERKTMFFIIQACTHTHTHTLHPTSDIGSLHYPLQFSGSQISIDERISIKTCLGSSQEPEAVDKPSSSHRLPLQTIFFFFFSFTSTIPPPPSLRAGAPSGSLHHSPSLLALSLPLFLSLSCLSCLWQIGKLCFTNVGTCVKWGSIVCLTGCLYYTRRV